MALEVEPTVGDRVTMSWPRHIMKMTVFLKFWKPFCKRLFEEEIGITAWRVFRVKGFKTALCNQQLIRAITEVSYNEMVKTRVLRVSPSRNYASEVSKWTTLMRCSSQSSSIWKSFYHEPSKKWFMIKNLIITSYAKSDVIIFQSQAKVSHLRAFNFQTINDVIQTGIWQLWRNL